MIDSKNEIENLSALARSIRANSEKISRQIQGENAQADLLEGIERMCDIVENKLENVGKQISEVKKDV